MLMTPVLLAVLGMLEHSAAGSAGPVGLSSWYHVIRLLLHSAHGSLLHKVRRNVGQPARRIREKCNPKAAVSHFTPSGRTCCQSPRRNVRIMSCSEKPVEPRQRTAGADRVAVGPPAPGKRHCASRRWTTTCAGRHPSLDLWTPLRPPFLSQPRRRK